MCFFGHSIGNYHWPSPQSAQKHPSPNPNTNPSPRPLETSHSPLLAGPFSLRLGLAADNPMAPTFPLSSWAALGRVIISEMFWLAFAFYADLLAVVVLWQICFAHFWCDSHSSAAPEARSPKLDARWTRPPFPLDVRLKSAKKFYFKQFSFAFVWLA